MIFRHLRATDVRLEKLTITATGEPPFEAQFNPTSYKHSYRNTYQKRQGINTSGAKLKYLVTAPEVLHFTLILQETMKNMTSQAMLGMGSVEKSVYERVQKFLGLAYHMDNSKHAPRPLVLTWGNMTFEGALESADINYTAFNNSGKPIRAELNVSFKGSLKDPMGSTAKNSPDLTHAHTVKEWQTLPMITDEIYGDPHLYLLVADANGLDHFRALHPGQKLHFPPTEKDESTY